MNIFVSTLSRDVQKETTLSTFSSDKIVESNIRVYIELSQTANQLLFLLIKHHFVEYRPIEF